MDYQHLEHNPVQTRCNFERKFNDQNFVGPSENTIKALIEKFEQTRNINIDIIVNVGRCDVAVQNRMLNQTAGDRTATPELPFAVLQLVLDYEK